MDDVLKKSLESLKKFFKDNSDEYIKEEIDKIDKLNIGGVPVNEYFESFHLGFDFNLSNNTLLKWDNVYQAQIDEVISLKQDNYMKTSFNLELKDGLLDSFQDDKDDNLLVAA